MPWPRARGIVVRLESNRENVKNTPLSSQHYNDVLSSRKMKLGMAHLLYIHTHRKLKKNFRTIGQQGSSDFLTGALDFS